MTHLPPDSAAPPIDLPTLQQLRTLDPEGRAGLLKRVLQTYVDSLARLLGQVRQGQESQDMVAIGQAVHTLRSSSAAVGALALAEHCRTCEAAARQSQWPQLQRDLPALLREADRVGEALRGMLDSS